MARIQAIRGMNDILPEETPVWRFLEDTARQVFTQYGIDEVKFPIVEQTALFVRSIGEVTDIVEKEMYTFNDRNGDSLTLRPEGTAGCVRAAEQQGMLYNQVQRFWYSGPMFRYERPQKGRYRQFHQIGVECFGMSGPDIDAELIVMTARLWDRLGLSGHVELELNSIGSAAARGAYKSALVEYLSRYQSDLDEDSQRRLSSNPLRILDSKDAGTQKVLNEAPVFQDYMDADSRDHFDGLRRYLDDVGIAYKVNPKLVRGLDYYSKTVFEWITSSLGAQGTVCGGGRYDGLVEQLGGRPTPAVGFAMGIERLVLMLTGLSLQNSQWASHPDFYVTAVGEGSAAFAFSLAEKVRSAAGTPTVQLHCGGGSFKSQMKKADKSNARYALLIGESEVAAQSVTLKPLRADQEQKTLPAQEFLELIPQILELT